MKNNTHSDRDTAGCLRCIFLNPYTITIAILILCANGIERLQDDTWAQIKEGNYKGRIEVPVNLTDLWFYRGALLSGYTEISTKGLDDATLLGNQREIDEFEFSRLLVEDERFRKDLFNYLKISDSESYGDLTVEEFENSIRINDKHYQMARTLHSLSTPYNKLTVVGLYNFYEREKGSLQYFARKLSNETYRKQVYEELISEIPFRFNRPSYEEFSEALYNKPGTINPQSAMKELKVHYQQYYPEYYQEYIAPWVR